MVTTKKSLSLGAIAALALALGATSFFLSKDNAQAQEEQFEKCYGIAEIGKNDGWGKDLNPGKYKSEQNFDGKAWKFVEKGTCVKLGGQMEAFEGIGTPTPTTN